MQKTRRWIFLGLAGLLSLLLAPGAMAQARAPDFALLDERGQAVNLHYHGQDDAIVLMMHRVGSEILSDSARELAALSAAYSDSAISMFMINAQTGVTRADLAADKLQGSYSVPILQDSGQLVSDTYGLDYAGEVILIDPSNWRIVYRGPIGADEGQSYAPYFEQALDSLLAGEAMGFTALPMPERYAGELITLGRDASDISYSADVVPILREKCVSCHLPDGIAPWSMTSHAMVQGFAPMIREVILTKRMPPWHADPQINSFKNDIGLSVEQARTIVHWIDAGAVDDSIADPLLSVTARDSQWQLGEPDLIVELPAYSVPATGTLDYQILTVDNPLDHDVWVRAVQILPSDRQVLHHAIATFGEKNFDLGLDLGTSIGEALFQSQLMTFVPGNELYEYPEGTGVLVPAGSTFYSQMHYTTYGRETTDQSKIGLYFSEAEPDFSLQHYAMVNLELRIPAGAAHYEAGAYYEFQKAALIYALFPHAHYRGRSSTFALLYPDGKEELVLSVPNYDFNWQRYFQLGTPLFVPQGARLIHRTVFDNSENNLSNPDPSKRVFFGEQTWQEMLYGGVSFRYFNKEDDVREIDIAHYLTGISMGYMDLNMDGMVALDEMPEAARQGLALAFVLLDKDKSGGLEFEEFAQLMLQMTRADER